MINSSWHTSQDQGRRELEMLRLKYIEDVKIARQNGADAATLQRLKEDHEESVSMVREQYLELMKELMEQVLHVLPCTFAPFRCHCACSL